MRGVRRCLSHFMKPPKTERIILLFGAVMMLLILFFVTVAIVSVLAGCANYSIKVDKDGQPTKYIAVRSNLLTGKGEISVSEETPQ